jgi:hypothetical protein
VKQKKKRRESNDASEFVTAAENDERLRWGDGSAETPFKKKKKKEKTHEGTEEWCEQHRSHL